MRAWCAAVAVGTLLVGCGDNSDPDVRGPHRIFAMTKQLLPHGRGPDDSFDLNGDGTIDNQMGMVLDSLDSYEILTQAYTDQLLAQGTLAMTFDVQIPGANDGPSTAGLATLIGSPPHPPVPAFPEEQGWMGRANVVSVMTGFLDVPIQLDLADAHVAFTEDSDSLTGKIAGGVSRADITEKLIPAATVLINDIVRRDCPSAIAPYCLNGCTPDTHGKTFLGLFDADHDCAITPDEVRTNSLIVSLVSPDVALDGVPYLSFGFRFEAIAE